MILCTWLLHTRTGDMIKAAHLDRNFHEEKKKKKHTKTQNGLNGDMYLRPYAYKKDILTTELSDQLNIASS